MCLCAHVCVYLTEALQCAWSMQILTCAVKVRVRE